MDYRPDKEEQAYIDKLELSDKICSDMLSLDDISNQERDKITELQEKNKRILEKLKSREFSVAVIGEESSGKSTVLNALMNMTPLPDDTGRCTYTTTTIRAGERDFVQVFFYSAGEFRQKFSDRLKEIGYEENADFDNIDKDRFDDWVEEKRRTLSNGENSISDEQLNIAEDIRNMLDDKDTIKKHLTGDSHEYKIGSEESRLFITGRRKYNDLHRMAHPYAVREIIIYSKQLSLEHLENMVLYDVPGFNSPTNLHREQTKIMLETADAIIMIHDMQQDPDITREGLEILRTTKDVDGIPLQDKLFIFGNKHDMAVTDKGEVAERNKLLFLKDVEKYSLTSRAVVGSGKIRLIRKDKLTERDLNNPELVATLRRTSEKMEELGIGDGIEELNTKLKDYYNNDRAVIRKKRAAKNLNEITEYLESVAEEYKRAGESDADPFYKHMSDATYSLRRFPNACGEIVDRHNAEIKKNKEFSQALRNKITEIFPFCSKDDPMYKKCRASQIKGGNVITDLEKLDRDFRQHLNIRFQENLTKTITELTRGKQAAIREEVINKFLDIIGVKENREDFFKDAERLFIRVLGDAAQEFKKLGRPYECRFDQLVNRFTGFLIEALILRTFGGETRRKEVLGEENSKFEILSLAVYYGASSINSDDTEKIQQLVLRKIMTHEGIPSHVNSHTNSITSVSENDIKKFFREQGDSIFPGLSSVSGMALPYSKWAKLLSDRGERCALGAPWVENIKKGLRHAADKWNNSGEEGRKNLLEWVVNTTLNSSAASENIAQSIKVAPTNTLSECLKALQEMPNSVRKSEDDIIDVLNQDIYVLRDLVSKAAIMAMGLERTFITIIDHNSNFIRKEANNDKRENNRFQFWIEDNIRKIRKTEWDKRDKELSNRAKKKEIAELLDAFLKELSYPSREQVGR